MRRETTIPSNYFERMYQGNPDPWSFDTSAYERDKYIATISALPRSTYQHGLEVGCANGTLTSKLAQRCARLLAVDTSKTALDVARRRLANNEGVSFEQMQFPLGDLGQKDLDLIVLSEVVYYWDDEDIKRAGAALNKITGPGADVVLVHWTGETDYPQHADDAVEKLAAAMGSTITVTHQDRTDKYRLDVWRLR